MLATLLHSLSSLPLPSFPLEMATWLEAKEAAGMVGKSVTHRGLSKCIEDKGSQAFLTVGGELQMWKGGRPEELELSG